MKVFEAAHVAVVPVCPHCGRHAQFMEPTNYAGCWLVVACGCGWVGRCPTSMPLTVQPPERPERLQSSNPVCDTKSPHD